MIAVASLFFLAFAAIAALVIDSTRDAREISRLRSALEWERGLRIRAVEEADSAKLRSQDLAHSNARLAQLNDELSRALSGNLHGEAR